MESRDIRILVVVDMQKDFVDRALGTKEAVAIVPAVAEKIRQYARRGDVILATRDTHEPEYLQTREGKHLPVPHCIRGSEGWQLCGEVAAALPPEAVIVDKPTFGSTALAELVGEYVARYGAEHVHAELVGLCTDICVVSNALLLKAFYPEMPLSLDPSCCAGVTPESHEAALATMRMCQIDIL